MAVGGRDDAVSVEPGVGYLAADVLVGGADDHAVLGSVVLVLVLDHQALAGEVVGLALTAPAELDLVALVVSLVLHKLNETLEDRKRRSDLLKMSPNKHLIMHDNSIP